MTDASFPETSRKGFSLLELTVCLGLVAILSGLVMPVALSARDHARSAECRGRLRQLGTGLHMYAIRWHCLPHEDAGDTLPPKDCAWYQHLPFHGKQRIATQCPTCEDPGAFSYKMNSLLEDETHPFADLSRLRPSPLVLLFDAKVEPRGLRSTPKGTWTMVDARHPDGAHVLMTTGEVLAHEGGGAGPFHWNPETR
ncbi:MAG: type II secretion system protein [Planctomycetota bacterium]